MKRLALLLLSSLLVACGAAPPLPVPQRLPLSQLPNEMRQQGLHALAIDAARSSVRIHVFRAGRAAHLGHNHVLSVPTLAGFVGLPEQGVAGARFELAFRLDELELDRPQLRAALGPGWASAISPEAIAATRANMLGDGNLQAERFPWVRLRSLQIGGELPTLAAQVEVELHGQTQVLWLPLRAAVDGAQLTASGAFVLRQSDFGIAPFSVLGGLLAVKDELVIEFELVAQASPSKGSTSTSSPAATSP